MILITNFVLWIGKSARKTMLKNWEDYGVKEYRCTYSRAGEYREETRESRKHKGMRRTSSKICGCKWSVSFLQLYQPQDVVGGPPEHLVNYKPGFYLCPRLQVQSMVTFSYCRAVESKMFTQAIINFVNSTCLVHCIHARRFSIWCSVDWWPWTLLFKN